MRQEGNINPIIREFRQELLLHAESNVKSIDNYCRLRAAIHPNLPEDDITDVRDDAYSLALAAAIECCLPMEENEMKKLGDDKVDKMLTKAGDDAEKTLEEHHIPNHSPDKNAGAGTKGTPDMLTNLRSTILLSAITLKENINTYKNLLKANGISAHTTVSDFEGNIHTIVYNTALETLRESRNGKPLCDEDVAEYLDLMGLGS